MYEKNDNYEDNAVNGDGTYTPAAEQTAATPSVEQTSAAPSVEQTAATPSVEQTSAAPSIEQTGAPAYNAGVRPPVSNGVPPVSNGVPPVSNGVPPVRNAVPPMSNGVPTQNRYAYYSDGSRRYAPAPAPMYPAYPAQDGDGNKKGKGSKLVPVLVAVVAVLLVALIGVSAWILIKDEQVSEGNESSAPAVVDKGGQSSETEDAEDKTVSETVKVNPSAAKPGDDAVPEGNYGSLVELYNKCAPSCVTIISTVELNNGFYVQEGVNLGSGFVIEGDDPETDEAEYYIITNHHVIDEAKSIEVKFYDEEDTYKATLIGSDELTDIAVLTIEKEDLVPLEMGDSDTLSVGEWVIAIGTPSDEEFAGTMSYGIISGVDRDLRVTNSYGSVVKTMTVIQTTATLNPGNSGGPLINMAGQVVGINAMKLSQNYEGMGFALPSTSAVDIINSLIQWGEVVDRTDSFVTGSAKLGITGMDVTDEVIEYYNLGEGCPKGVLVSSVSRGTAVYDAGLSIYDVITEFNGQKIEDMETLQETLKESSAGTTVELTFYRPGRRGEEGGYQTISFKLDYAS